MGEQQNVEGKKNEAEKNGDDNVTTVVLKVDMHCEGCAKKIKRSLSKHFDGVQSVNADCGSNKLTVVGKVNPTKVKDRVEEKMKKKVELVSPQPNIASKEGGDKKQEEKKSVEKKPEGKPDAKKSEEKEKPKEPPLSTVVLKTRVHCEGCAHKIKKIIVKYEGVQDVNVDLQNDTITVNGTMNMKELLPYLNIKLKRSVEIVQPKKDEGTGEDKKPKEVGGGGGSEKVTEGGGSGGGSEKPKEGGADKKDAVGDQKKENGGKQNAGGGEGTILQENTTRIEVNKLEYGGYPYAGYGYGYDYTHDPRQHGEGSYGHQVTEYWHEPAYTQPPQLFSDENPNGCSVM